MSADASLPPERARPRRRKLRPWLIALIAVVVLALIAAGGVALMAWNLGNSFDTKTHKIAKVFPSETARPPSPTGAAAQAQNILLMGSDTRGSVGGSISDISGQRSDTIMVMHIPANRQHVYIVSIMRDSWVDIAGHGQAKINAALSYGGVPLAVQTIEGMLGARIDHVALIDFEAFKGLTNALGGVTINNPAAFTSSFTKGETFPAGPQHINGSQALDFVRERYAFPDGDFQRVRDQQIFLKAVMESAISVNTLGDPGRVSKMINTVAPYLAVDDGLNAGYIAGLAVEMRNVRSKDISFLSVPTAGTGTSDDGQSIVNVDWDKLAVLKQAFQTDTLDAYTP